MIKPTLGRTVLVFRPAAGPMFQPALICHVHSEARINVGGFDCMGAPFSETSVLLLQPGEKPTPGQVYAVWPPREGAVDSSASAGDTARSPVQGIKEAAVEAACRDLNMVAPRVKVEDLDANIVHCEIVKHVAPSGQILRWAVLTTRSGYAVTGRHSAAVSAANDRPQIGEQMAIENARTSLWELMGYELRSRLAAAAE